ncbi:hypothetical protein HPB52_018930 [Rhipicephalus sanguineus]|uniref:Uncharacterized protein n=1 Tax=Rhipicephalus sanguineus TaxID=34632 RepID=A0A9D4TB86_RHISA|nr:hypothetical protein HPB52_018930 [Rhipicephalus sanguineus]
MGRDVPSGTGIKRKFDDTAAACSGESPACNAKKLSTGPLEVGMSTNLEVVEGGAADAADSLGDLARHQRICLLCTLPCLLAEAGYPKQQHLEATCAMTSSYVSSALAIEDGLPDDRVLSTCSGRRPAGASAAQDIGEYARQPERDFLFEKGTKDTACHCHVVHRPRTLQEARRQPVALSRGTERPYIRSIALRPAVFSATVSLHVCGRVGAGPPGARGVASGESLRREGLMVLSLLPSWNAKAPPPSTSGCMVQLGVWERLSVHDT